MRRRPRSASLAPASGVVALLVADIVLVTLAVRYTAPIPAGALPEPTATTAPSAAASSSSPPTGSPGTPTSGGASTMAVDPVPLRNTMVALSGAVAWRTSSGSCDGGGGSVSVTSDGGRTWSRSAVPAQVVIRVRPKSANGATVIATERDCRPGVRLTADGGSTWSPPTSADGTWFRDAKDPLVVHSPAPRSDRPCGDAAVLDLAPLTVSTAHVLCGDGSVRASADTGASWRAVGVVPQALALDSRVEKAADTAYVVRVGDGCAGLQVVRVEPTSASAQPLGCVDVSGGPVEPGTITLSVNGPHGWLGVGERVWRSTDDLRTWASG